MTIKVIITIVGILSLLSFVFVYQFSYNDYVYAFKPNNTQPDGPTNEIITTTNTSKPQQQSTNTNDSLLDTFLNTGTQAVDFNSTTVFQSSNIYGFVAQIEN
jgi:hypothetical protein